MQINNKKLIYKINKKIKKIRISKSDKLKKHIAKLINNGGLIKK